MPMKLGILPDLSKIRGRAPVIWIHALSVGEVNAVMPLIRSIMEKWPEAGIICSASTSTGMAALDRKTAGSGCTVTSLPLDLPPVTSHVINGISPDCFILTETDIWPGFIWSLRKRGIPALLINGSISSHAAARLAVLKRQGIDAAGFLYGGFHVAAMQSDHDLSRLLEVSGRAMAGRLTCGGNLKFDISVPRPSGERRALLMKKLAVRRNDFILVAGSTHPGEEKFLLSCFRNIKAVLPELRFIVAPRDPKRSQEIEKLAESMNISSCMKSEGCSADAELIILDTLGELSEIYALGHMAFVGGSLVPTGGHNLFEPAAHGIPVLWGPYTESCTDMAEIMEKGGAGIMIKSPEQFEKTVVRLGTAEKQRKAIGRAAEKLVKKHGGSVKRYLSQVETVLDQNRPMKRPAS